MPPADDVPAALDRVRAALPAGEERPGQVAMAEAVARAIGDKRHVVVQAGTGTGKSLGYLVPAIFSGRRVVVATATKALQDQLAGKDIPSVAEVEKGLTWAVLKGRSNYLCRQAASEASRDADAPMLPGVDTRGIGDRTRWDVLNERKVLRPRYNRAGALESVALDADVFVERIAYDAKGQRSLIALSSRPWICCCSWTHRVR